MPLSLNSGLGSPLPAVQVAARRSEFNSYRGLLATLFIAENMCRFSFVCNHSVKEPISVALPFRFLQKICFYFVGNPGIRIQDASLNV